MGSFERRGSSWRARVRVRGVPDSATFPTKQQAVQWALQREAELQGKRLPDHAVKDALRRFADEVLPGRKGERAERLRLVAMERDRLAAVRLPALRPADVAAWKERRLQAVSGASVRREMNLLLSVLEIARREWGWLHVNPARDVKRPPSPPSRKRRVSAEEAERIAIALGVTDALEAETARNRTGLAWLFALETAMRSGEIVGLHWKDVGAKSVRLPVTKNGDERQVPLSLRAREILAALPRTDGPCFGLTDQVRDVLFREARAAAGIVGLNFHDSRAEAIWRLSRKLDVMELARVIGHRDLRSLLLYYNTSADDLADRL